MTDSRRIADRIWRRQFIGVNAAMLLLIATVSLARAADETLKIPANIPANVNTPPKLASPPTQQTPSQLASTAVSETSKMPAPAATSMPVSEIEHQPLHKSSGASTAAAQKKADDRASPSNTLDVARVLMSLTIVIGLIIVARFAMRKLFPAATVGRNSQAIRVISRSVLAPKQQFLLLKVGKRLIVVGDSGTSMNALAEITDPDEVSSLIGSLAAEAPHSSVSAFDSLFKRKTGLFARGTEAGTVVGDVASSDHDDEDAMEETAIPHESIGSTGDLPGTPRGALLRMAEDPTEPNVTPADAQTTDSNLIAASTEIRGLMDRVRMLSEQVRGS